MRGGARNPRVVCSTQKDYDAASMHSDEVNKEDSSRGGRSATSSGVLQSGACDGDGVARQEEVGI
jgi:hypothetical protein